MAFQDNKKIAFNSIFIFVRICVTSIVSLLVARIALDALGASDYGLYNVVGGIVTFLNVVNSAMISTTYRYLAYEVGKKENGYTNKIFNTSILIHLCFALFIFIIGGFLGEWYILNYLNVAEGKLPDAQFVFRISLLTAVINTIFIPNQGLLVAYEKFSITVSVEVISQLIKLALVFGFLYTNSNRIRLYSLIMLSYTVICGLSWSIYCIKNHWSTVKPKLYKDWKLCKEMLSYALWTLFGAVASIGKNQGAAILLNYFFGTLINAAFAVANQISSFVNLFAGSLSQAAVPQITKTFSAGNQERSLKLTCYISKYDFILMLFVAFPTLLETKFLLGLWLIDIPEGAVAFCKLTILGGLLNCLGGGIPSLVNATGNIKKYQLTIHTFILLLLPISFLLFEFGFNAYYISIAYCIIIFLSAFLKLYMLNKLYHFRIRSFYEIAYTKIFKMSIPLLFAYYLYNLHNLSSFPLWGHIVGLIISEVFLALVILALGMDSKERIMIKNIIKSKINR